MSALPVAGGWVAVHGRARLTPEAGPGLAGDPVARAREDRGNLGAPVPPGRLRGDRPQAREPVLPPTRLGTGRPGGPCVRPTAGDLPHLAHLRDRAGEAVVVYEREPYFWPWATRRIAFFRSR